MIALLASTAEAVGLGDLARAVLVATLACLPLGISVWALLDAARRPRWVWALSKHPQTPWMAAVAVGVLLTVVGLGISLWYLLRVRPTLAAIERGDLGTVVTGGMRYLAVSHAHEDETRPSFTYHEVGPDGREVRRIEHFLDGGVGAAGPGVRLGRTELDARPVPTADEINDDPTLDAEDRTAEEFERAWRRVVEG